MTSEITSPAANAELVRAGFQAFNAGDVGECLAHIASDLIIHTASLFRQLSRRGVRRP